MSMNLANLINDGKLKKSFMVATLVSTLLGTFTAAATLHDKVQEKRFQAQQKKTDDGQDKQIQSLRQEVEQMQLAEERERLKTGGGSSQSQSQSQSQSRAQSQARSRSRRQSLKPANQDDGDYDDGSDDFDRQAQRSKAMISREFDENVRRLGQRYAEGDVIAENKLQAQIITLQQTVIDVLQEALMDGRSLSNADIRRLIAAQDRAKQGSLDAMRDQYQRMLVDANRRPSLPAVDDYSRNGDRRQITYPASPVDSHQDDSFPPPRRVRTFPAAANNTSYAAPANLYCRYAFDLQSSSRRNKPIHSAFSPNGSQRCPACSTYIPLSTSTTWILETRTPLPASQQDERGDLVEVRKYTMDARLVLKSHTEDGGFACVICYQDRTRDADALCNSVDALVKHIGRDHTREDFEGEVDIWRE